MGYNIAVIGSRQVTNITWFIICDTLNEYRPGLIISGGAAGVDSLAEIYAAMWGIEVRVYYPDYVRYGRAATHIRNRKIVDDADLVLAFYDGESRGTKSVIKYAHKKNREIRVIKI